MPGMELALQVTTLIVLPPPRAPPCVWRARVLPSAGEAIIFMVEVDVATAPRASGAEINVKRALVATDGCWPPLRRPVVAVEMAPKVEAVVVLRRNRKV